MSDPGSDTIEGVTLEAVARTGVLMHGAPPEQHETIAQAYGVPPGRYGAIAEAWMARMQTDPTLAIRYNEAYQQAMVEAGVTAPDVSVERYVDMIKAGGPTEENLAAWGLTLQQFSMISHRWTQAMGSDPALAQRFAELFQQG